MEPVSGSRTFQVAGSDYDRFMGRYSQPLAGLFVASAGVQHGQRVLDVGCGPGALTGVLSDLVGINATAAIDPTDSFITACRERHPGVDVRQGSAEAIPFEDAEFDAALAQLVLHFVSDATAAGREMRRVVKPGGAIAACVWDFESGMEMLRAFWDAALDVDPGAPDEARVMRFGRPGEIAGWMEAAGLTAIAETTLHVASTYRDFDELWSGFLAGVGPAGAYCVAQDTDRRAAIRQALFNRLGEPTGEIQLGATARSAIGRVPT